MAAALATSPNLVLLHELLDNHPSIDDEDRREMKSWTFPKVTKVASIYGVLDQQAWRTSNKTMLHIGTEIALNFCFRCYLDGYSVLLPQWPWQREQQDEKQDMKLRASAPSSSSSPLYSAVTIGDLTEKQLCCFPPCLLACGTNDPLIRSNRLVQAKLQRAMSGIYDSSNISTSASSDGHAPGDGSDVAASRTCSPEDAPCHLLEYPGIHAYLGLPVQWTMGQWRVDCLPNTIEIIRFLKFDLLPHDDQGLARGRGQGQGQGRGQAVADRGRHMDTVSNPLLGRGVNCDGTGNEAVFSGEPIRGNGERMRGAQADAAMAMAMAIEESIREQFKPAHGPAGDGFDATPIIVWGIVGVVIATLYVVAFAAIGSAIAWALLQSGERASQWAGLAVGLLFQ
jgi:hypothetical protein